MTPSEILSGPPIDAEERVKLYSSEEYERFIEEWAAVCLKDEYTRVWRVGGANDMGRDVLGFVAGSPGEYDNYQCKHYDHALRPSDAWLEIGKLCWYSFNGDFTIPRKFYFVAPRGVGPTLARYLGDKELLKSRFKDEWADYCSRSLSKGREIRLEGDFERHVDSIDFGIFGALQPSEVIRAHSETRYHAARFGGGLKKSRPRATPVPEAIAAEELRYVQQLVLAYSEVDGTAIPDAGALAGSSHKEHFVTQRECFYRAAALEQFERDNLPTSQGFDDLKRQMHDGVVDVHDADYPNGLERLRQTLVASGQLQITNYVLVEYLEIADRKGICHHLANEDRLVWCRDSGGES